MSILMQIIRYFHFCGIWHYHIYIGDKNEKGDITRLFNELCPRYKYGSLNGLATLFCLVLINPNLTLC